MNLQRKSTKANSLERCVAEAEKAVIMHVLLKTKGNRQLAANLLEIEKTTLDKKIKQHAIDYSSFE